MTGFIYVIDSFAAVKIGWAKNPVKRFGQLRVGAACHITLVGFVEATRDQETELHWLLRGNRTVGEWFEKCPAVLHLLAIIPRYEPAIVDGKARRAEGFRSYLEREQAAGRLLPRRPWRIAS